MGLLKVKFYPKGPRESKFSGIQLSTPYFLKQKNKLTPHLYEKLSSKEECPLNILFGFLLKLVN